MADAREIYEYDVEYEGDNFTHESTWVVVSNSLGVSKSFE